MRVDEPAWRDFVHQHFAAATLGDARRNRRLVESVSTMLSRPGGSLPQRFENPSDLQAFYRLMDCPDVTHQSVLEPYVALVREHMADAKMVLILHDTTELDYSSKKSLEHLGQLGNGLGRGYICHNALAITPQRQVLGLACQILHTRRRVPEGESRKARRQAEDRESRLWEKACRRIGPAPTGSLWIDIADRGADTFEFIAFERSAGRHFVIRSCRDRPLSGQDHVGDDRIYQRLHELARDLPPLGLRELWVPPRELPRKASKVRKAQDKAARSTRKIPGRRARLQIAAGSVRLEAPAQAKASEEYVDVSVVRVGEIDAPAGVEPLEWILLTDLEAASFGQACQMVDFYATRPLIEEFHKGQKTGCRIEALQFTSQDRLEPAIGLLSVVAATLLALRALAREPGLQETLARELLPWAYVKVLSRWRFGQVREMTALEFVMALGRLGGHLNRRSDGHPGWLTLFRGWEKLALMVRGAYPAGP